LLTYDTRSSFWDTNGHPQLYGTQFHASDQGVLEPFPIEDQDQVDTRRAEVGLDTLAEYTATIRARHTS
jgi:hypothetical protein